MYGVQALAGRALSLEGGSKHLEIHGETASDRLKPGLHTLCPSFAYEICGLGGPEARLFGVTKMTSSCFCLASKVPVKSLPRRGTLRRFLAARIRKPGGHPLRPPRVNPRP